MGKLESNIDFLHEPLPFMQKQQAAPAEKRKTRGLLSTLQLSWLVPMQQLRHTLAASSGLQVGQELLPGALVMGVHGAA